MGARRLAQVFDLSTRLARLQNVSTTGGESGGLGWTAVNETELRNGL
jgi:hypothetical protein